MKIAEALAIVLDLANQSVLDEKDCIDETQKAQRELQMSAIGCVFLKLETGGLWDMSIGGPVKLPR